MTNWKEQIKKMREQDFVTHSYNTVIKNNSMLLDANDAKLDSNVSSENNKRLIELEEENKELRETLNKISKKSSTKEIKEIIEKALKETEI